MKHGLHVERAAKILVRLAKSGGAFMMQMWVSPRLTSAVAANMMKITKAYREFDNEDDAHAYAKQILHVCGGPGYRIWETSTGMWAVRVEYVSRRDEYPNAQADIRRSLMPEQKHWTEEAECPDCGVPLSEHDKECSKTDLDRIVKARERRKRIRQQTGQLAIASEERC